MGEIWLWVLFNLFVVAMLALDLGVFHREAHAVSIREALFWSVLWVLLALAFNVWVYYWRGSEVALQFLTGYLVERALSVDNIFVFLVIFSYFQVPAAYQHRVLVWGILGALVMRAIFIFTGVALLARFHWLIYVFGAFLVFTGIKMALHRDEEIHPERNPVLRLFRRLFPSTEGYEGPRFFVRRAGRLLTTPLAVVLLVVETTDLVFALDSIPAVLAITRDPFIVYTSNVFAILGLRALYFAVAGLMEIFHYLHYGLSAILVFVGVKMMLADVYHLPVVISLGVVSALLVLSIVASLLHRPTKKVADDAATKPTVT
ncbi:MAG: TerC family protein [Armatimonadota bacterium]|nr:TerC family protein [Armatimonadota bacterium]